jgi:hypothetical protein
VPQYNETQVETSFSFRLSFFALSAAAADEFQGLGCAVVTMKTMMLARISGTTELLASRGGLAREKKPETSKNAGFKAKNATIPVYPLLGGSPESGTGAADPG